MLRGPIRWEPIHLQSYQALWYCGTVSLVLSALMLDQHLADRVISAEKGEEICITYGPHPNDYLMVECKYIISPILVWYPYSRGGQTAFFSIETSGMPSI